MKKISQICSTKRIRHLASLISVLVLTGQEVFADLIVPGKEYEGPPERPDFYVISVPYALIAVLSILLIILVTVILLEIYRRNKKRKKKDAESSIETAESNKKTSM